MPRPDNGREDPRVDWGPGEWYEETQRLEAEVERLREALREIAGYSEHGRHSAITPATLAAIAQRALDTAAGGQ